METNQLMKLLNLFKLLSKWGFELTETDMKKIREAVEKDLKLNHK